MGHVPHIPLTFVGHVLRGVDEKVIQSELLDVDVALAVERGGEEDLAHSFCG